MIKSICYYLVWTLVSVTLASPAFALFGPSEGTTSLSRDVLSSLLIAEMAGQKDQLDLSVSEYVRLAKKTKDGAIAKRATQIALYASDIKSALIAAKIWAEVAVDDRDAQHILTTLLFKANKGRDVLVPLERVFETSTKSNLPPLQFSQFVEQIALEIPLQAEVLDSVLKKLKKKTKAHREVLLAIAVRALANQQFEEAREAAEQVLLNEPHRAEAIFLKAKSLLGQNNVPGALSFLADASAQGEPHYGIQTLYAKTLLKVNDLAKAEVEYNKLLKSHPTDIHVLLGLLLVKIEQRQFQAAQKWIQQAIQIAPNHPLLQFYKGYLAEKRGQVQVALKQYLVLAEEHKLLVAAIQASILLGKQKKFNEAFALLESVEEGEMDDAEAVQLAITKASLYRSAKRNPEALTLLNTAIKKYPGASELLYVRALVNEQVGDLKQVEEDFKALLKVNPNDVEILNALAYVLADKTDQYEEALEWVTQAFRLKPNDPSVLDTLGWVHYRLGHLQDAYNYLQKAYQLSPQSEIAGHLGEVLWVMGKKNDAQNLWQKALSQDPNNAILKAIIQKWKM